MQGLSSGSKSLLRLRSMNLEGHTANPVLTTAVLLGQNRTQHLMEGMSHKVSMFCV